MMLVASSYWRWAEVTAGETAQLSKAEQQRFWGETAAEAYRLQEVVVC